MALKQIYRPSENTGCNKTLIKTKEFVSTANQFQIKFKPRKN